MATGQRLLPQRLELDLADEAMTADCCRFLKNLTFYKGDTSEVTDNKSSSNSKYRPLESTQVLDTAFRLPDGYNHFLGAYSSKDENCVIFHYYNDRGNHGLYIIYGESQTIKTVYLKDCLNYQLNPENFIHEGGAYLEVFKFNDPSTGLPRKRSYYNFTDGYNDMRFICIEDSISTNGFDPTLFPYFVNPHNPCLLINAGVEPPKGCIGISEVINDNPALQNNLKFNTWQFMVRYIDVYGRPSEWSDISGMYIPGVNDCIGSSDLIARCVDLTFDAGSPLVNIIEVAFRNCNDPQWYKDNSLFLYKESNLGDWWTRQRNASINFNPATNQITYRFCKDKECNPIAQEETNRTENPLPRITQSVAKIGKFLGVVDNLHGFFPFGDDIMNKIEVQVSPPSPTDTSVRNIEIFVPIYNFFTNTQQPVYKDGNGAWVWGGRDPNGDHYVSGIHSDFKQYFGDDNRTGFIGYLAGTGEPPNSVVSETWYVNDDNEFVQIKPEDLSIIHVAPFAKRYFLKFTFNSIAPAQYTFRIASSLSRLADTTFPTTSANVYGSFSWSNKYVNFNNQVDNSSELVVNVCDGDYSSLDDNKVLTILDLTYPGRTRQPQAFSGYVSEKIVDDKPEIPIELLRVDVSHRNNKRIVNSPYTDHNGFYFGSVEYTEAIVIDPHFDVNVYGNCGCNNYKTLIAYELHNDHNLHQQDNAIEQRSQCSDYATSPCNRVTIKGFVKECGTDVPVPGVGVVLSRGQYAVTGADGSFSIIAHYDNYLNGTRVDKLTYVPTICAFKGCETECVPPMNIIITKCTDCEQRTINVDDVSVKFESLRGLLSGGNYGVAVWGADWLGRHGFAQTRDKMYFTTQTLIQSKIIGPSKVNIIIPPDATFPSWVDELKFGITKELSMGGIYMTWIVDKVEFIDNTGKENNTSPTQIKIYYGSLIEYNSQNNFNTTTGWQFIVQNDSGVNTDVNQTSDFVEFYINGDGQYFPTLTRSLIKYDKDGQYFLIEYDTNLKDLKQYAYVRLGRPLKCSTQDVFYQICGTVKVIKGKAQQQQITLNAFDTYYKYRQIPIPVGTPETPENVVRTFGFPFEHSSPSDFWGDHCINIGKINSRNPYESEIIRENQTMLSGALSVNGQLNYLNYFDENIAIDFDSWDFGGIVSAIPFVGGIRYICQYSNFTVGFNDNMLRVNANGQVIVPSADSRFGNPQVNIGNDYGCSFFDKNTIRSNQGLIMYLDSKEGVLIRDNFIESTPVSRIDVSKNIVGGVNSWLVPKIKYLQNWNKDNVNKKYFSGTINPAAREYLITDYTIRSADYVNNERQIEIQKHETLSFDYLNIFFRQFIGYTPQGYGYLEGQIKNIQLFSFSDNVYFHYSTTENKTYNTFYGVVVSRVMRIVVALDPFQKKQFANVTILGKKLYFSDFNRTDSGQQSRILISAWKQGDFYWGSSVLCNLFTPADPNTPDKINLTDGDKMYGSIFDIRLIGNPADDTILTELLGVIIEAQPEGKVLS